MSFAMVTYLLFTGSFWRTHGWLVLDEYYYCIRFLMDFNGHIWWTSSRLDEVVLGWEAVDG